MCVPSRLTVFPSQPAHHLEEFAGAGVAGVLVEVIAEGTLFVRSPPMTTLSRIGPVRAERTSRPSAPTTWG